MRREGKPKREEKMERASHLLISPGHAGRISGEILIASLLTESA
jgi:hypothetical protein